MRLLITRPEEDAEPLATALAARGIASLIEPLLTVADVEGPAPDLAGVQALLVTSANGVRAFARKSDARDLPLFAVGDASAAAARQLGFTSVKSAAGDVATLARLVTAELNPRKGALLHVAGSKVAGDLAGELSRAGFTCRRQVLYEARPARSFGAATRAALDAGAVDGVLLFSPRTASTFARLITDAGIAGACRRLNAYCLSRAVADAVSGLAWRDVVVARAPTQESLLDAVAGGPSAS